MNYYAGLDVSMKETSIAIVNHTGKIVFETSCETNPETIGQVLKDFGSPLEKIGIESGCITFWLIEQLQKEGFSAICIETKQMATLIALNVNKTDKNDARSIANAMRCNLYKEVHNKSKESIEVGIQMGVRRTLINIRTELKNSIRGYLKAYGVRLGSQTHIQFPEAVRETIKTFSHDVKSAVETLLKTFEEVCRNIDILEEQIKTLCKNDPVINLFKTIPGVGPITALTYKAVVDNPHRFKNPRNIGAYLGLTPRQYASGDVVKQGKVSKCGNSELRMLLVECAVVLLTKTAGWTKLKAWGLKVMKRSGLKKAAAAVGRKLAIIMLRMWQTGETYVFGEQPKTAKKEVRVAVV